MVHVLFGVAHATADQCADNHGCDCRGKAEIPDFCASCGKQRGDAENRQERGGEVAFLKLDRLKWDDFSFLDVSAVSDLAPLAFDSAEPDIRDTANAPDA